jgi:hypothetical protein
LLKIVKISKIGRFSKQNLKFKFWRRNKKLSEFFVLSLGFLVY